MADPYSAAAGGIESGFGMAMRAQEAEERRQRTRTIETREAEELGLRRESARREERRLDRAERRGAVQDRLNALAYGARAAQDRISTIEGEAKAVATGGGQVSPELAARYGDAKTQAEAFRQEQLNLASRLANGDVDIDDLSPKQLATMRALTTGFKPDEWARVPQAIKDAQAALATGNMPMTIEPMNVMLAPYLARGIGQPSAHGGNVVAKRIINVVPAQDANGSDVQGYVYPVIRVVTDQKGPDGTNLHYDAPMTGDGSVGGRITPVSIQRLMDRMGNLGVAAEAFNHPGLAARLAQGDKEAEKEINEHLNVLRQVAVPTEKPVTREKLDLGDRVLDREVDATTGKVTSERELKKGATPRTFRPGGGGSGGGGARGVLQARLDEIDRMVEDGEIPPEEATELRKSAVAGIKPAATKPNAKEVSDDEQAAVNAVASRMGLDYDPNTKSHRSRDGKSLTPEQKDRLGAARSAIQAAARKAAGAGKRASPDELAGAVNAANKPAKTVKWGDLK